MKLLTRNLERTLSRVQSGMTLAEVVVAMSITGLAVAGIVTGYVYCTTSAEKAGLNLVANARAMERLEETRSVKWDTASSPPVDLLIATNFPSKNVTLDLSGSGVGVVTATLNTSITQISTTPPLRRIRVDCIWKFKGAETITNTIETCRAPDQ
jgi:prepilin-type N-terminal cleavage/methylation domain-containing protein